MCRPDQSILWELQHQLHGHSFSNSYAYSANLLVNQQNVFHFACRKVSANQQLLPSDQLAQVCRKTWKFLSVECILPRNQLQTERTTYLCNIMLSLMALEHFSDCFSPNEYPYCLSKNMKRRYTLANSSSLVI